MRSWSASLCCALAAALLSGSARAEEGEPAARAPHEPGTAMLVLGLGLDIGGRRFTYSDGLTSNARGYDVFGAPMPAAWGEAYPFADTAIPVLRDLGVVASYARAVGLQSATASGEPSEPVATTWERFALGLRLRFRTGGPRAPILGLSGKFGSISFDYDAPADLERELPEVSYRYLRAGLDARIPVWRLAALVDFGYLGALSAGEVYDRFRGAKIGGIEVGVGIAVVIAAGFEARVGATYTRYFSAFSPVPGDAYVAGGALDELLGLHVGAAYVY